MVLYFWPSLQSLNVGSGSGRTNVLLNLIKHQLPDIDSYAKDPFESKYQLFIIGTEKVGIEILKNTNEFIEYSETIDDVYEKLEDYNPIKCLMIWSQIWDLIKNFFVTELFLRERERNILVVLISQSYFKVPKTIRINRTQYFIMNISNKREFQQIASNNSSDIDFKDIIKLYKDHTK